MSPATYEAVPTSEENLHNTDLRSTLAKRHSPSFHKLFIFVLAFCLVSLVSYKAGQWSVEHLKSESAEDIIPASSEEEKNIKTSALPSPLDSVVNNTDMPGTGKYSVG